MGRWKEVQEVGWTKLQGNAAKVLPEMPNNANLQLEPDANHSSRSIPDVDIPDEARDRLKELLNIKHANIMSQTAMDIGRTNLIELDIPTEGPPIASKPHTVPLKYCKFMDHKIKQLEEAGIISRNMSDWASPILVVPKKEEGMMLTHMQVITTTSNSTSGYALTTGSSTVGYRQCVKSKQMVVWVR